MHITSRFIYDGWQVGAVAEDLASIQQSQALKSGLSTPADESIEVGSSLLTTTPVRQPTFSPTVSPCKKRGSDAKKTK